MLGWVCGVELDIEDCFGESPGSSPGRCFGLFSFNFIGNPRCWQFELRLGWIAKNLRLVQISRNVCIEAWFPRLDRQSGQRIDSRATLGIFVIFRWHSQHRLLFCHPMLLLIHEHRHDVKGPMLATVEALTKILRLSWLLWQRWLFELLRWLLSLLEPWNLLHVGGGQRAVHPQFASKTGVEIFISRLLIAAKVTVYRRLNIDWEQVFSCLMSLRWRLVERGSADNFGRG